MPAKQRLGPLAGMFRPELFVGAAADPSTHPAYERVEAIVQNINPTNIQDFETVLRLHYWVLGPLVCGRRDGAGRGAIQSRRDICKRQGVSRDDAEVVKWFRKAARRRENGKGVTHDDAEAAVK
jgi:hypothetical protein